MNSEFFSAIERIVKKGGNPRFQKNHPQALSASPKSSLEEVSAAPGPQDRQWILTWPPAPGVKSYEIQSNPDPAQHRAWISRLRVSESRAELILEEAEGRVWLRVRALTATGPGPWSSPVALGHPHHRLKRAA